METDGQPLPPDAPETASDGGEFIDVHFTVPRDLHQRVQDLAAGEGWPPEEALLTVLSHGAAYVAGQADVERINRGDADVRAEAEKFHSMAMQLDGSNAVLKFRAYQLGIAVRTLEWNVTGLRGEHGLAHTRLEIYRSSEQELKNQLATLKEENERLTQELAKLSPRLIQLVPPIASPSGSTRTTAGIRGLLRRILRR